MDLKFWPFPIYTNYKTSKKLTSIFLELANCPNLTIVRKNYGTLTVKGANLEVMFWVENEYYAWASEGVVHNYVLNSTYGWKDQMPSRYAIRKMAKALETANIQINSKNAGAKHGVPCTVTVFKKHSETVYGIY
jgi:hypothetical protein